MNAPRLSLLLFALSLLPACGGDNLLTRDELMDPASCKTCHPVQFKEWSGSMHAYAADDPVFLAMNKRGQRETNGELGDFCVNCHAPMAVRTGATTDGSNLADLPQSLKGVTCFFCHSVASVEGDHNNPLVLADDGVMRGGIPDPVDNGKHRMAYSGLHASDSFDSSNMCGSCHDIVTPAGVHLERTFAEWKTSVFHKPKQMGGLSCGNCHMPTTTGTAADFDGVPLRDRREHAWPGIDVALTNWPEKDAQLEVLARDLYNSILPRLCVQPAPGGVKIEYKLDNVFAGHGIPSGAGQDRRMWAEVIAYDDADSPVLSTGVVEDGQPVAEVAQTDPLLWQIRDFTTDENGDESHMFWDARDYTSELLPPGVTNVVSDPAYNHSVSHFFDVTGTPPARVTARVQVRPIGLDVLDDLVNSGDLNPSLRDAGPTLELSGSVLEWTSDLGYGCVTRN